MIIIIPVEINKRELIEKIFLSTAIIKKLNAKIYLIKKHFFFKKIKDCRNLIFFDKGISFTKKKIYDKLGKKNHLITFDVESPIINWDRLTFDARLPSKILKNTKIYFTQNDFDKSLIVNKFKGLNDVITSGNPKYELSKKKNSRIIFKEEINKICEEFGKNYIFFSSSYSIDLHGGDKLWRYYTKKVYRQKSTSFEKLSDFEKYEKNDFKNYLSLINLAITIAKKFPKKKVIFRPHPSQDINLVRKRFPQNIKNLHLVYKYHAIPWIFNCEWFFHTHCSTFIDAHLMKKRVINFYQSKETRHKKFFNYFSTKYSYNNEKDVIKLLKSNYYLKSNNKKNEFKKYSKNFNENSHQIISKQIHKRFKNMDTRLVFNNLKQPEDNNIIKIFKKFLINIKLFSQKFGIIYIIDYIFDLKPNMFLNHFIIENKGGNLSSNEINFYLNKTNKIYNSKVRAKYLDKNIFLLFDKKNVKKNNR